MNNQSIPPIHREHFEQWLDSQPDSRTWNYWCRDCVFGTFMREFYGAEVNTLSRDFHPLPLQGRIEECIRPLPEWFMTFAREMNETGYSDCKEVTMPALREAFNLPKERPSPFEMVGQEV